MKEVNEKLKEIEEEESKLEFEYQNDIKKSEERIAKYMKAIEESQQADPDSAVILNFPNKFNRTKILDPSELEDIKNQLLAIQEKLEGKAPEKEP